MKKILCAMLCGLPILLWQSGCVHGGAYTPVNTDKFNQESTAKFVCLDAQVQTSVTCASLQESQTAEGRLRVKVNVRNRENRRLEVQINCVFKDAQGFTEEETPFQTLILTENEIRGVEFTAMNEKAKNYTVRVRQAR